jgi:hypothetical protein
LATSEIADTVFCDLTLDAVASIPSFDFELQRHRDIQERNRVFMEEVSRVKHQQKEFFALKHDVIQDHVRFWRRHRPPTAASIAKLLPDAMNNYRVAQRIIVDSDEGAGPCSEWTADTAAEYRKFMSETRTRSH